MSAQNPRSFPNHNQQQMANNNMMDHQIMAPNGAPSHYDFKNQSNMRGGPDPSNGGYGHQMQMQNQQFLNQFQQQPDL